MSTSDLVFSAVFSTTGPSPTVLVFIDGVVEDSGDWASMVNNGGVATADPGGGEAVCEGAEES